MTSTITAPAATDTADGRRAVQVKGPQGTIVVFVPGDDDPAARSAARSVACKAHGGIAVGRTPIGQAGKLGEVAGHVFRFSPVTTRKTEPTAAVPAAPAKAKDNKTAPAPVAGQVRHLAGVFPHLTRDQLAALAGFVVNGDPIATAVAPAAPAAPARADRPAPEFLTRRRNAVCMVCADLGVIRNIGKHVGAPYLPTEPGKVGPRAYRTANGAAGATAKGHSLPCPSHTASTGKKVKAKKGKTA